MSKTHSPTVAALRSFGYSTPPMVVFGVALGLIMPILSALIYPTYYFSMHEPWVETTRLLEFPFVAFELIIYLWASHKGLDIGKTFRELPKDIQIAGSLLLAGIFVGSLFTSNKVMYSLTLSFITVVHLMFAFAVAHLVRIGGQQGARAFLTWLSIGLVPLLLFTAIKFSFPPALSQLPFGEIRWDSSLPGFIHLRHFGSWTGAIAAGLALRILYLDDRDDFSWSHVLYFLAAAMSIWSGTRGAIFAIVLTFMIVVMTTRKLPSMRAMGRAAIITGFALCAAFWFLPDHHAFYLFMWADVTSLDAATSSRTDLWSQTFAKWLESPIFGWGSGSTFWEVYIGWTHTQPHNSVLQFLISWGLVGAISAFWILSRGVVAAHRALRVDASTLPLMGVLYALLLQSLIEGMLHYPRFIIVIVMLLVFLILKGNEVSEETA